MIGGATCVLQIFHAPARNHTPAQDSAVYLRPVIWQRVPSPCLEIIKQVARPIARPTYDKLSRIGQFVDAALSEFNSLHRPSHFDILRALKVGIKEKN